MPTPRSVRSKVLREVLGLPSGTLSFQFANWVPQILLLTTDGGLWFRDGGMPPGVLQCTLVGDPSPLALGFLVHLCREWKLPAFFVGDLAPIDLATYLSLRQQGLAVEYVSIQQPWTEQTKRWLRLPRHDLGVQTAMNGVQERQMRALDQAFLDLRKMVPDDDWPSVYDGWQTRLTDFLSGSPWGARPD